MNEWKCKEEYNQRQSWALFFLMKGFWNQARVRSVKLSGFDQVSTV